MTGNYEEQFPFILFIHMMNELENEGNVWAPGDLIVTVWKAFSDSCIHAPILLPAESAPGGVWMVMY